MDYKMKDSGVEWIGKIPDDWHVTRLKDVTLFKTGGTPPESIGVNSDGIGIRWFKPADFKKDSLHLDHTEYHISDEVIKSERIQTFPGNSVLLVGIASIGKIGFTKDLSYSNQQITGLIDKGLNFPKFTAYSVFAMTDFIRNTALYTVVPIVNNQYLSTLKIAYPDFKEQTKIAGFLDDKISQLDAIIEKSKASIEKLQAYRKSVIYEAVTKGLNETAPMKDTGIEWIGEIPVGWEISKIKYLGEYFNGLTYDPDDMTEDSGTIVLRANNIQNGKLIFNEEVCIDMKIPNKLKLRKDDILICSRNGSRRLIGKNALVTDDFSGLTFGAFNMVCRSDMSAYLYYVLNSDVFNSQLSGVLTSTINQLTGQNFGSMVVPNPPLTDQKAIVDYLDTKTSEIDSAINKLNQLIDTTEKTKKSIIYEYVTGKKRVPDFNTGGV